MREHHFSQKSKKGVVVSHVPMVAMGGGKPRAQTVLEAELFCHLDSGIDWSRVQFPAPPMTG